MQSWNEQTDVLQCRWIFHCPAEKEGKEVTLLLSFLSLSLSLLLFLRGSLLSRQPRVKMHDHHSSPLYRHIVPHPHCLTISYRLKFMTPSHCRNWFSMLWFPAASKAQTDFEFLMNMARWFFFSFSIWCGEVLFDVATTNNGILQSL